MTQGDRILTKGNEEKTVPKEFAGVVLSLLGGDIWRGERELVRAVTRRRQGGGEVSQSDGAEIKVVMR